MGKENSREKTHKSNMLCASCAFSRLFHCILSSGLLCNRFTQNLARSARFPDIDLPGLQRVGRGLGVGPSGAFLPSWLPRTGTVRDPFQSWMQSCPAAGHGCLPKTSSLLQNADLALPVQLQRHLGPVNANNGCAAHLVAHEDRFAVHDRTRPRDRVNDAA